MGLACKIAGHKWNKLPDGSDGCTCSRCGERRDEGHDYQLAVVRDEPSLVRLNPPRTCMKVCSVCGRKREAHPRSQADIDYENAMIASDSGLYTTA